MTTVKVETNFASFPNVGHDAATVLRFDFLDDRLEQSQPSLELLAKPRSEASRRRIPPPMCRGDNPHPSSEGSALSCQPRRPST